MLIILSISISFIPLQTINVMINDVDIWLLAPPWKYPAGRPSQRLQCCGWMISSWLSWVHHQVSQWVRPLLSHFSLSEQFVSGRSKRSPISLRSESPPPSLGPELYLWSDRHCLLCTHNTTVYSCHVQLHTFHSSASTSSLLICMDNSGGSDSERRKSER